MYHMSIHCLESTNEVLFPQSFSLVCGPIVQCILSESHSYPLPQSSLCVSRRVVLANNPPSICTLRQHQSILAEEVQHTDHTWNPTQNGKKDVNQEISTASSLEEDRKGWKEDGEEIEANIGLGSILLATILRHTSSLRARFQTRKSHA
jgi:hypothetical protein